MYTQNKCFLCDQKMSFCSVVNSLLGMYTPKKYSLIMILLFRCALCGMSTIGPKLNLKFIFFVLILLIFILNFNNKD
jgi:hypothetical protein